MKIDIFSIPIFIDKIDLEILNFPEQELIPTWDSQTLTSFGNGVDMNLSEEAAAHLCEVITKNLAEAGLFGQNPRLGFMWRNKYSETDYQDVHIHPHCQWSFIIYETMKSQTSFLNPSVKDIQNQIGTSVEGFPLDYKPDLGPGDIIIFPSFLFHSVNRGAGGTSISGNIYMEYN